MLTVARDLLGATVRHGPVRVRLTEVEAYGGTDDPASHAARGPTPRSEVMFGPPGRAYVYFIYGMHWCLNLVCGPPGRAAAVLVRAGEVVDGLDVARARAPRLADRDLARGPGRLARALGVDGSLTGSLVTGRGPIIVEGGPGPGPGAGDGDGGGDGGGDGDGGGMRGDVAVGGVLTGPRVGVRAAHDLPWRLWLAGDPTVSTGPRRPPGALPPGGPKPPSGRRGNGGPKVDSGPKATEA
ncbi:DNA-3-methyladenine glycosylase [Pseudofrankia asymbiotica]|uniref:Putative 3-methyladenine DNA glycosylase n=1 Tax=Pseudofrankia asymbiotica TaxID=1834516 RepID=A0A1V2IBP8_9ACTN|nr:3-methyladenine DNA glycosylase [Pseudofrankia asymbiotica]